MKRVLTILASLVITAMTLAADRPASDALVQAVRRNDAPAWQALLEGKANVNGRDSIGNSSLQLAALNHDLTAVRAFLPAGSEVDAKNAAMAAQPQLLRSVSDLKATLEAELARVSS